MLRHLILSIPLLFAAISTHAQVDSILALPRENQLKALDVLFTKNPEKSAALFRQFDELKKEFKTKKRDDLVQHIIFLVTEYNISYVGQYGKEWLNRINKEIENAREHNWPQLESALLIIRGARLGEHGKALPAMESMLRGCEIRDRIGWPNDHVSVRLLNLVGLAYYKFKDYRGTIPFLKHSLDIKLPQPEHGTTFSIYNTLGICYRKLEMYDSAMYFLQLAKEDVEPLQLPFPTDLINGNIGHIYYLQGKYDDAYPLLEKDYQSSLKTNEYGSAVNAALLLAIIAESKGLSAKAAEYIQFCKQQGPQRDVPGSQQVYFDCLNKYSKMIGDYKSASLYADSLIDVEHRLNKENDQRLIGQAKLSLEIEQHKSEMQVLESKRSRQVLIRNAVVVIMVLSFLVALLMIRTIQDKRKKESEMAAIREQAANEKLSKAQHQLQQFTQTLLEKNEMLKGFKEEIDFLHADQMDHRTARVQELVHQSLLTEADWRHFRQLFDEVHPGFLIRLKEKISDITPAEMRLVALTKLQITPKEMAEMLGISVDSVKKTRHRLRKKIHLPEDGDFEELVDMI